MAPKTDELYCPGCEAAVAHGVLLKDPSGRQHLCCPKQSCRRILRSRPVEVMLDNLFQPITADQMRQWDNDPESYWRNKEREVAQSGPPDGSD